MKGKEWRGDKGKWKGRRRRGDNEEKGEDEMKG